MPVSKKRKKNGKAVKRNPNKKVPYDGPDVTAGLSLQDLINVVAAQEFKENPEAYKEKHPEAEKETEDGR